MGDSIEQSGAEQPSTQIRIIVARYILLPKLMTNTKDKEEINGNKHLHHLDLDRTLASNLVSAAACFFFFGIRFFVARL